MYSFSDCFPLWGIPEYGVEFPVLCKYVLVIYFIYSRHLHMVSEPSFLCTQQIKVLSEMVTYLICKGSHSSQKLVFRE